MADHSVLAALSHLVGALALNHGARLAAAAADEAACVCGEDEWGRVGDWRGGSQG